MKVLKRSFLRIMALSTRKSTLAVLIAISLLTTIMIVQRSRLMTIKKKIRIIYPSPSPSPSPSIKYNMSWTQFTPEEKESKWKRCRRLISGEEKVNSTFIVRNDSKILDIYKPDENCEHVLHTHFPRPKVTREEANLPIAYGFTIYKGASLFERILRAIYMPHNVYCIHIDKKSPEVFDRAIQAIIRCLPNVFIAANRVDVVWGHFSVVQAQLECMKELLESSVKWKYYINLIGQDFPLYENKEIVVALKGLNNTNSMESTPMPRQNQGRTKYVVVVRDGAVRITGTSKPPPPNNMGIYKGSTHIIITREFARFVLYSEIGKSFTEFLKDTAIPDETIYASLQQHPLAPGGIPGEQPEAITRALLWDDQNGICLGKWVRHLCWLSVKDLRWALGMKNKIFIHKIPFDFNEDILECILVVRQGRKYGSDVWDANLPVSQTT